MLVVVARYVAKPGRGDEVEAAMREMIGPSRAEEGCLLYYVNRSQEDPDQFLIYEHYRDRAALDFHRQTEHFRRTVLERVLPLLERREVELFTLVEP